MLDSFLSRIGAVAAGIGLLVGVATSQVTLGPWIVLARVIAILLIVGGVAAVVLGAARSAWKWRDRWWTGRGAPRLDVEPTGGPSQDVRLVVTNHGRKTDIHATAATVATRNYLNRHREGSYALMWLGRDTNIIPLDKGQRHALLLARWKIVNMGLADRMGDVQLMECNGTQEALWDGFRWNFSPTESLPEFDIDVTIVGSGLSKPFRRSYTLRPSNWIGPLEVVERVSAAATPPTAMPVVSPKPQTVTPTHIARPYGMTLHPRSDIDLDIVSHHWIEIGGQQSLSVDVRIHNTNATGSRTIKRHRFEFESGVQLVSGDELVVYLKGSSYASQVGTVEPLQTIEGTISCQISTSQYRPDYDLYIEDDLGRESKAAR